VRRKIFDFVGSALLVIVLSSWGYTGHSKISKQAGNAVANKIAGIENWIPFLTEHSCDPDYRKFWVKTEVPKHYIDIDNYPEFVANGTIIPTFDSLTTIHGDAFITEQGTLPWATLAAFDSLTTYFKTKDFHRAKWWANNLSHYVGDGHMPLHITRNYDGEETGNKGIHLRYESKMIINYNDSISIDMNSVSYVDDVPEFVFNYLYQSNRLCDSIFNADNKAKLVAGNTDSPEYLAELWKNSSEMTAHQFSRASCAVGWLVYTAWVKAGSPNLTTPLKEEKYDCEILSLAHNSNDSLLTIDYAIFDEGTYKIDIRTPDGGPLVKGVKLERTPGHYSETIDISNLSKGNYLAVLDCINYASTKKFITE
jgi:hypothetical protein